MRAIRGPGARHPRLGSQRFLLSLSQASEEATTSVSALAGEGGGFGGGEIAGGGAIGVEEVPAMGAAAAREDSEEGGEEDRDEGGHVPIAGKEQNLDEGGGREDRAERSQHTGTGETVPAMDMGAEGAGPVPHEEDARVVSRVMHGDPLRVHVDGWGGRR